MGVLKVNVGDAVTPDWRNTGCGTAGPPMYAADTFDRTDSSTLGTSSSGHTWTAYRYGAWGVSGNRAYLSTGSTLGSMAVLDGGTPDAEVSVTLAVQGDSGSVGIAARVVDADNMLLFLVNYLGALAVFRVVGGGYVDVTPSATSFAAGDVLSVNLDGSACEVFKNGVSCGTVTTTAHMSATLFGLYGDSSSATQLARLDDFTLTGVTPIPGRLKLNVGTAEAPVWVREVCDGDTTVLETHPLKVNVGTPEAPVWETAACMVPV